MDERLVALVSPGARTRPAGFFLLLLLACAAATGCEGRYANLGESAQPEASLETVESDTWVGDDGRFVWVLVAGAEDLEGRAGAVFARISRDGTTVIETGTIIADRARGTLEAVVENRFTRLAELEESFLGREGSVSEVLFPPLRRDLTFADDDQAAGSAFRLRSAELDLDVGMIDYTEAVTAFDPTDDAEVITVFRLLALPLFLVEARVPFFGSERITELIDESPVTGSGILGGAFRTTVEDPIAPRVEVELDDAEELTGVTLTGRRVQETNLSGDGTTSGRIAITVADEDDDGATLLDARIDLGDLRLRRGVPSAGTYGLELAGLVWTIDAGVLLDLDLSLLAGGL